MYLIQMQASKEMAHEQGQQIQYCITLLGNLLRIPTARPIAGSKNVTNTPASCIVKNTTSDAFSTLDTAATNRQHQLLWNMFSQGLGTAIISLTLSPHRDHW